MTSLQLFWDKVEFTTDCWNWTSSISEKGYGQFSYNRKNVRAHRFAYQHYKGEIPVGLELDHLCRNRKCVNPDHLEAVTHQENIHRSINAQSKRSYCPKGHPYSGIRDGHRVCHICRARQQREYLERSK